MNYFQIMHVTPVEAEEHILREGILVPATVYKKIEQGELKRNILGVSFGRDSNNHPEYVSLLGDSIHHKMVGEIICHSRTGYYRTSGFKYLRWIISEEITEHPEFLDEEQTKQLSEETYPSEILYKGNIPPKFIKGPYPWSF